MNKRYINAADLWNNRPENLDPKKSEYNRGWSNYAEEILAALEATPTADVEEVRHGEWIYSENEFGEAFYRCSICDCQTRYKENYCSECGAKMDGERRKV